MNGEEPEQVASGTFAERLRQLRRAAGITQEELAGRAGLSQNAVGALERGQRRRPYPHTVRALAEALGLAEADLTSLIATVPERDASPGRKEPAAPTSPIALPHPATPLMGRERELEEVSDLLARAEVRLLTLTGVGGVGKTRLALEVARLSSDSAAFVGLAPVEDPALFAATVLRSLGAPEPEDGASLEALAARLGGRNLVLMLDNFEHLLDAAPEVAYLIEACPGLTVLATSRAPLRVRGEKEYPVAPLALPPTTRQPSEGEVGGSPAGALFVERARATSSGFRLTGQNAADVAAICWRLAGIPLAIELAAANTKFLDPATLLSRLDRALSTAWGRDLPERQRTMRATLDWSYGLLPEAERELFRKLSVFVGGFALTAAETVGATGRIEVEGVLERLGTLVEQSLVVVDSDAGGRVRYGMLEPIRQYATEKLQESGEDENTRWRHAAHYLDLGEHAASELWGSRQAGWLERLERENGNLRAAITWAVGTGQQDTAGRLCWALWLFWWARGHHREGRQLSEEVLGSGVPTVWRARVLPVAAAMFYANNEHDAAEDRWREGLFVSVREQDSLAEGYCRAGLGLAKMARGNPGAAAASFGEALPILDACGDPLSSLVRVWLGTTSLLRGDAARAEREVGEGLGSARARGDTLCTYVALYNLAQLALARGDLESASGALEEGVELSGRTRDRANLGHFLDALSAVAALRGEAARSAVLLGAAEESLLEVGAPVYNFYNADPSLREHASAEARAVLSDATFEDLRADGREMTFEGAIVLGTTRPGDGGPAPQR